MFCSVSASRSGPSGQRLSGYLYKKGFFGKKKMFFFLDWLSEYLEVYDKPLSVSQSRLLRSIPLEGLKVQVTGGKLKMTTKKGKKLTLLPVEEQPDLAAWADALQASSERCVKSEELEKMWRQDQECAVCLDNMLENAEDEDEGNEDEDMENLRNDLFSLEVEDVAGKTIPFKSVLGDSLVFVLLLRHFGCAICKHLVSQWNNYFFDLERLGIEMVAVGSGAPNAANKFQKEYGFPGRLYTDQKRNVYKYFNCRRGMKYIMGLKGLGGFKNSIAKGFNNTWVPGAGDNFQIGGAFLMTAKHGVLFQYAEAYAGDQNDKVDLFVSALRLISYAHPVYCFPGVQPPPSWDSMPSDSLSASTLFSVTHPQFHYEIGLSEKAALTPRTSSTGLFQLRPSTSGGSIHTMIEKKRSVSSSPGGSQPDSPTGNRRGIKKAGSRLGSRSSLGSIVSRGKALSLVWGRTLLDLTPHALNDTDIEMEFVEGDVPDSAIWATPRPSSDEAATSFPPDPVVMSEDFVCYYRHHFFQGGHVSNPKDHKIIMCFCQRECVLVIAALKPERSCAFSRCLLFSEHYAVVRCLVPSSAYASTEKLVHACSCELGVSSISRFEKVASPAVYSLLVKLESRVMQSVHVKLGLVGVRNGEVDSDEELYRTATSTPALQAFMELMGEPVDLLAWPRFRGDLDISESSGTGEKSLFTEFQGMEVMYHVTHLITPPQPAEDLGLTRKRYLGNDLVLILFLEEGVKIDPHKVFTSNMNHVFILVSPMGLNFRIEVMNKPDVRPYPPSLPNHPVPPSDLKEIVLTKAINAQSSSIKYARGFQNFTKCFRQNLLNTLASDLQI